MKLIEIIREPCVLCPKTAGIVLESECQKCEHFYGWNLGETKIGCKIPMPEPAGLERWVGLPVKPATTVLRVLGRGALNGSCVGSMSWICCGT